MNTNQELLYRCIRARDQIREMSLALDIIRAALEEGIKHQAHFESGYDPEIHGCQGPQGPYWDFRGGDDTLGRQRGRELTCSILTNARRLEGLTVELMKAIFYLSERMGHG